MSSDLTRLSAELGYPSRRTARAVSRIQTGSQLRLAQADAETDVALAKLDDLTLATGTAMASVTRVAQAQRQLETLVPDAAGRLAYLADDHLLGMTDVLADLRHQLRRV